MTTIEPTAPGIAPGVQSPSQDSAAECAYTDVRTVSRAEYARAGLPRTNTDLTHSTAVVAQACRTANDSRGIATAPESAPRPVAPAPNLDAIPAELIARVQWVCWSYALGKNGKWTKVPYTPGTTSKASHSRPASWRSFADAVNCYQARPDFFDGIGYVFAKDDPYIGGDIDHSLDTERVPPTYAEISPSGNGVKFIARASGDYGRKTAKGELYSKKRFFTITGNVLPGHEQIADCQAAVEAFAASLGTPRTLKDGSAGSGSRAELAAQIPDADWEEARHLMRTQVNRLLARVRASAKEETQLAYLLRGDYAAFHQKWGFVGLYRADGSLDDSMVRAVAATGIRGRGFTFPEYVALMTHLYGAAAVAKWGTKQAWREELAALWFKSQAPRYAPRPAPKVKAPRGRAGDHATLVEQVYQLLLDHRAGAEAIVQIADLAAAVGANRRTIASILNELRKDHISTKRCGQYGGLIITFSDVIYSAAPQAELPAPERINDAVPSYAEETKVQDVFLQDRAVDDHISPPPTLLAAIGEAFDALPGERPNTRTGEVQPWPRTNKRILAWLEATYPEVYAAWNRRSILGQIARVRKLRRNTVFSEIRDMPAKALDQAHAQCDRTIRKFEQRAKLETDPAIRASWEREANRRRGRLALLGQERAAREQAEAKRIKLIGYSLTEQAEMLDLVDQVRPERKPIGRAAPWGGVCSPQPTPAGAPAGIVERLHALKAQRNAAAAA